MCIYQPCSDDGKPQPWPHVCNWGAQHSRHTILSSILIARGARTLRRPQNTSCCSAHTSNPTECFRGAMWCLVSINSEEPAPSSQHIISTCLLVAGGHPPPPQTDPLREHFPEGDWTVVMSMITSQDKQDGTMVTTVKLRCLKLLLKGEHNSAHEYLNQWMLRDICILVCSSV